MHHSRFTRPSVVLGLTTHKPLECGIPLHLVLLPKGGLNSRVDLQLCGTVPIERAADRAGGTERRRSQWASTFEAGLAFTSTTSALWVFLSSVAALAYWGARFCSREGKVLEERRQFKKHNPPHQPITAHTLQWPHHGAAEQGRQAQVSSRHHTEW